MPGWISFAVVTTSMMSSVSAIENTPSASALNRSGLSIGFLVEDGWGMGDDS
jgi:hypothetical protein